MTSSSMAILRRYHPAKYIEASILISLGGMLFGLDTGTIGPITTMPQFTTTFGHLSSTVHGLVVSTILIPAALSSIFGGHVANALGRLKGTALGAGIFGLGATVEAASVKLGMLIFGRAVKGIGEGLFLSVLVVYITEISPPRTRGRLAAIPQLLTTVGIFVGFFTCYGTVHISSSLSWRLPFALQAIIAYIFSLSTLTLLPESPRWLTSRGRSEHALALWDKLGVAEEEREKITEEVDTPGVLENLRAQDVLAVFGKNVWRQTALGVFLMGMQQLSGIDGVLYYAPLLFQEAGLSSSSSSFLASGITAMLIFLSTIPGFLLADRWGRKTSTLVGGILLAMCMLIIGSLYASDAVHAHRGAARWIVIVTIYLFGIIFSVTWAVCFRVYVSEIQSPKTRAGATSLALSANWTVNWVVAFITPILLARSSSAVYFVFAAATLITVIVCAIWMPETKGRSLEAIQESLRGGSGREDGREVPVLEVKDHIREVEKAAEGDCKGNESKHTCCEDSIATRTVNAQPDLIAETTKS